MKCDETKPECQRCVQTRRTCDGYAPEDALPLTRRQLAVVVRGLSAVGPAARVLAGPQNPDDVACFDFFRLRTAPSAGAYFPTDFWTTRLLQVAHSEPAVWNAAMALGALHRRWELIATNAPEDRRAQFYEQAAVCYEKALTQARSISSPSTLLVLSLALATVSNLFGHWTHTRVHVAAGLRLLHEIMDSNRDGDYGVDACTADALARIDFQAMTMSDTRVPYLYSEGDSHVVDIADLDPAELSRPRARINSLREASTSLLNVLRRLLILNGSVGALQSDEMESRESILQNQLKVWVQDMAYYMQHIRPTAKPTERDQGAFLALKIYHASASLLLAARAVIEPYSLWDNCLAHFERIVAIAAAMSRLPQWTGPSPLALEPGIILPLYNVATRCRHATLRRRAIALLRRTTRQEGAWHSHGAVIVSAAIIATEEEGTGLPPPLVGLNALQDDIDRWADEIEAEDWKTWLAGDENWVAQSTWDGVPRIPITRRVLDIDPKIEVDAGTVTGTMIFFDPEQPGGVRTRDVALDIKIRGST